MPLVRYFFFVGSALLGLLLLIDWCFPVATSETSSGGIDRSIIRIHSAQRWPAAVRIDAAMPMPQPAPVVALADAPPAPAAAAPVRNSYAYAQEPTPKPSPPKAQRRAKSASRWSARESRRRLASFQPNWFAAPW